jgi:glycosyltransferase involved in cell wall biosynthesis
VLKVAFVVQRCGREVNGGAESVCLQVAQRMASSWQVEILTTCALDYMSWQNWYPPGDEIIDGAVVRRFPVDSSRDVAQFDRASVELVSREGIAGSEIEEQWMRMQGPISTPLFDYLRMSREVYDAFFFFGYLYATTYFGLQLVADRSYLVPFAHDEWTIYLSIWDRLFSLPRKIVFSTEAERKFLHGRFPGALPAGPSIGIGISPPADVQPAFFRSKYDLKDSLLLLYAGRIDASKGCGELFDYFIRRQREGSGRREKLIVIGREVMPVPFHDNVIYLGFLSDKERWSAVAACDWLVLPSQYESLSLTLLEGWSVGRPAIVNGNCEVLVEHCRRAHGGLWYKNFEEWNAILSAVSDSTKAILGRQGMDYVKRCYSWQRVEEQYGALLSR